MKETEGLDEKNANLWALRGLVLRGGGKHRVLVFCFFFKFFSFTTFTQVTVWYIAFLSFFLLSPCMSHMHRGFMHPLSLLHIKRSLFLYDNAIIFHLKTFDLYVDSPKIANNRMLVNHDLYWFCRTFSKLQIEAHTDKIYLTAISYQMAQVTKKFAFTSTMHVHSW